jgi:hypothetical protein
MKKKLLVLLAIASICGSTMAQRANTDSDREFQSPNYQAGVALIEASNNIWIAMASSVAAGAFFYWGATANNHTVRTIAYSGGTLSACTLLAATIYIPIELRSAGKALRGKR